MSASDFAFLLQFLSALVCSLFFGIWEKSHWAGAFLFALLSLINHQVGQIEIAIRSMR